MTALNTTSFEAALKVHYTNDRIVRAAYEDHPFLALLPKMNRFGGKNLPIPIIYGNPQGRSSTFATAKANKTPGKYTDFVLTRAKDYGLASIDGETIEASKGDANAFMEAVTAEIDGTFNEINNSLAAALFRNGSGYIGKIGSTTTIGSTTLVLDDEESVVNFAVGQVLVASTAAGGGSVKQSSSVDNTLTVTHVDRDSGTLTVSALMDSFASNDWALGDYLFVQGDYDAKVTGLEAWLPATAPTSTAFFGVDRSLDSRLGGLRRDISNLPLEEGLINGASRLQREGGKPTHTFMSYNRYSQLEKSLGSKVQYVDMMASQVGISFRGIQLNTNKGPVTVLADQSCPDEVAYMLDMRWWKLYSLGDAPRFLMHDGLKMLRENDEDGVEVRTGYYAQLGCRAPGWNIRLALA